MEHQSVTHFEVRLPASLANIIPVCERYRLAREVDKVDHLAASYFKDKFLVSTAHTRLVCKDLHLTNTTS